MEKMCACLCAEHSPLLKGVYSRSGRIVPLSHMLSKPANLCASGKALPELFISVVGKKPEKVKSCNYSMVNCVTLD